MHEIYLDNNATTRPLDSVRDSMLRTLADDYGNPSSVHSRGDRGRTALAAARDRFAGLVGCRSEEVVFTSSGTEANNLALASLAQVPGARLITTPVEHSSVLSMTSALASRGVEIVFLPVGRNGIVGLRDVARELERGASLVSIQWVNNETGVIQPFFEIEAMCRTDEVPFHSDACQVAGKLPVDLPEEFRAYLSFTAHKFHGPVGTGALVVRNLPMPSPMLFGGSQERGLRAGTENLPGIVGMGAAAAARAERLDNVIRHVKRLRDAFESRILESLPNAHINGDRKSRVGNTTNLRFDGVDGQALVARLDQAGVLCSQSSACTNMRPEPSYVLRAMGLTEEEAYSSVRFSFSELNTIEEAERAADIVIELASQLARFGNAVSG